MQKQPRILVVGSFVMDVIATTEQVPKSSQTVYGKSFHMAPGGKGANQALQCARLGADVTMMGCVGDDLFGKELLAVPQAAGVDVSRVVVREGVYSGVGHVTLEVTDHTAQNRIVVISGANLTLTVEEVAWIQQEIRSYDMVLLQLEVPLEVNRAVAGWAKEAGVPVMLNPAPATDLDDTLLRLVSYLTPNEQEASMETGIPLGQDENGPKKEDLQKIAAALWSRGVENVIMTLGSSGSAVVGADSIRYIPFAEGDTFQLQAQATVTRSGTIMYVMECAAPDTSFLKNMGRNGERLIVNRAQLADDMGSYPGLKIGDLWNWNNNAGNWE